MLHCSNLLGHKTDCSAFPWFSCSVLTSNKYKKTAYVNVKLKLFTKLYQDSGLPLGPLEIFRLCVFFFFKKAMELRLDY